MIKLSSPWIQYVNKLKALFGEDPDIRIEYSDETHTVSLKVRGTAKAEALTELLPEKMTFGKVDLYINVIPANIATNKVASLVAAFSGNPIFKYWKTTQVPMSNPMTYLVFEKEVVQYFNDDAGDINGLCSTLYQEIAKELFKDIPGVFFCTDNMYGDGEREDEEADDFDDMPF